MSRKFVDDNALTYLIQKIKLWDGNKVDKETGKSLVSDTEIARLANITNYDDTAIQAAVAGKTTLAAVQALGYQTAAEVTAAINTALAGFSGVSFSVVDTLPATGESGVFYLISNSGTGTNTYDEYIWVTVGTGNEAVSRYEKLGTTAIDLSGYMLTTDMVAITNAEIDTIVAGSSGTSE